MKEIETSNGFVFKVDDSDFDLANKFSWVGILKHKTKYVVRNIYVGGGRAKRKMKRVYLHRFLLELSNSTDVVDHLDGDGLNNCRANLRVVTHQKNCRNRLAQANSKSGVRGVYWHKQRGKWAACIRHNNKNISLGLYEHLEDAAKARHAKEVELWGVFDNYRSIRKTMIEAAQENSHE